MVKQAKRLKDRLADLQRLCGAGMSQSFVLIATVFCCSRVFVSPFTLTYHLVVHFDLSSDRPL